LPGHRAAVAIRDARVAIDNDSAARPREKLVDPREFVLH
jgi:hypothetical protein